MGATPPVRNQGIEWYGSLTPDQMIEIEAVLDRPEEGAPKPD